MITVDQFVDALSAYGGGVVSPKRPGLTLAEAWREAEAALDRLHAMGMQVMMAEGVWEGAVEPSLVILGGDKGRFLQGVVTGMGLAWNQAAVLQLRPCAFSYGELNGRLVFLDGRPSAAIGVWTEVTAEEAWGLQGYTKLGGRYFTCR